MSPITRGVASLSPTTDGIASVSHATERVPIVSLNEQGVLDEFDTNKEKRKPRGRTKLSFLSKGKQLHVEFITRGQPFGENTAKFSFLFGATSRELLPVTLKKRKDLAEEFINQLWGHAQMAKLWRDHRSKLVKEVRKKVECDLLNRVVKNLKPDNVTSMEEWKAFIKE
ncbi:hypothetical protein Q3G72_013972 [Acer saccharum]|nr:hypothetical protein Q3G72_013972 [Acer saccharum]